MLSSRFWRREVLANRNRNQQFPKSVFPFLLLRLPLPLCLEQLASRSEAFLFLPTFPWPLLSLKNCTNNLRTCPTSWTSWKVWSSCCSPMSPWLSQDANKNLRLCKTFSGFYASHINFENLSNSSFAAMLPWWCCYSSSVHCGCSLMHLTNFVISTHTVQNSFSCGGLSCIYMSYNSNIAIVFQWYPSFLLQREIKTKPVITVWIKFITLSPHFLRNFSQFGAI